MVAFRRKIFSLVLMWMSICFPRSNLTVKDIQVGTELDKTRIVFVLSAPVSLYVEISQEGTLFVRGPEDTYWNIQDQKGLGQGAVESYALKGSPSTRAFCITLKPYTRLMGGFLRGNRYIIDLLTEEPPPPPPEEEFIPEPEPVAPPPPPVVSLKQTLELPKNEINSINILPKEDNTTWVIINSDKQDFFEYEAKTDGRKLYLYVPKINWPTLQTQVLNSGSITSYTVDESTQGASTIIMDMRENTSVIDLFSTQNLDGTYDFGLVLANRLATEEEVKRMAEKRVEIKGFLAASKSISFKINPPQLDEEPSSDRNEEAMSTDQDTPELQNQGAEENDVREKKESLFDASEIDEQKQYPEWVNEARSQIQAK